MKLGKHVYCEKPLIHTPELRASALAELLGFRMEISSLKNNTVRAGKLADDAGRLSSDHRGIRGGVHQIGLFAWFAGF
jgi:hypothetical protein